MDATSTPRTLDLAESSRDWFSPRQEALLLWTFLGLGVLARAVRYLLNFPLWEDEAFLCVNLIDRGYGELLLPLDFHQVAPPLFLWIELTLVRLLDYSEWVLRLFPFACSLLSLVLFRRLAGRLLRGPALIIAVAVFAVAYPGIRYAAEAKQYASDLCASLVLLSLAVAWWQSPGRRRWLWALAFVVPWMVGLSYPAVFVAGGISTFAAVVMLQSRDHRAWVPWSVYNALLVGAFGGLFFLTAKDQSSAELDFMRGCWSEAFPPLTEWWRLPGWLVTTHVGPLFAYPVGGERGASALTGLFCAAGLWAVLTARRLPVIVLFASPFVLHLLAAALERYPYGGHVKFSQHLAPWICCLFGLGLATSTAWFARRGWNPRKALSVWFLIFAGIALGSMARDVSRPYKTRSDERARAFARWFWFHAELEGDVQCLKTDLHRDFSPLTFQELSWSATYLCNQRIYRPRRTGQPIQHPHLAAGPRPLRCVLYRDQRFEFDEQAYERWLQDVQRRYELSSRERFPMTRFDKRERQLLQVDYLECLTFFPKAAPALSSAAPDAARN